MLPIKVVKKVHTWKLEKVREKMRNSKIQA